MINVSINLLAALISVVLAIELVGIMITITKSKSNNIIDDNERRLFFLLDKLDNIEKLLENLEESEIWYRIRSDIENVANRQRAIINTINTIKETQEDEVRRVFIKGQREIVEEIEEIKKQILLISRFQAQKKEEGEEEGSFLTPPNVNIKLDDETKEKFNNLLKGQQEIVEEMEKIKEQLLVNTSRSQEEGENSLFTPSNANVRFGLDDEIKEKLNDLFKGQQEIVEKIKNTASSQKDKEIEKVIEAVKKIEERMINNNREIKKFFILPEEEQREIVKKWLEELEK